ncbi:short-subunit dehydrogenase [Parabacteroides sp. PFB2-10]|uniref:SDR family NAD(P)-dependent oxidoreductase n=1 Tax=Parabacteroides sp. PFB2-10 TaxID=1742405 RepID=UPI00247421BC|nr:SDR family NAD(P)-dependent oxidoreductase [Parabacteroides sp. PFB2-10]MDH6313171.1 short-subunit dehydrogenase [Parabacteroides sp. PFB2-10]
MKRIVIVGATSGIGREVARLFIQQGWRVGVAGRRQELLESIRNEAPGQVETEPIDVTAADAPERLYALIDKLGGMDIFFLSSGVGWYNPSLNPEVEMKTVETNVKGFTQMVDSAFHYFKQQGKGHIAVISSIAGTKGLGASPAYSATKRYQNTYIDALAQLARMNKIPIRFTDIRPGFVSTDLLKNQSFPLQLKPEKVACQIEKALLKKKRRVIIDWKYNLLVFFWRFIPLWIWERLPIHT